MSASGLITRASLSLADLAIVNDTYDVFLDDGNGLDVGVGTWRRTTVESPFASGRVLTQALLDVSTKNLRVDVKGSSASDVQTKIGTLIAAVSQFSYELSLTLDTGATYRWECEPADFSVGFTLEHVFGFLCPVNLSIPASPTPVTGPI